MFRNRKAVCFWCNYFYLHMMFTNNSVLSKRKLVIKIPCTIIFRDRIDNTLGAVQKSYLSPGGGGLNQHVRMVWDRRGGVRDGPAIEWYDFWMLPYSALCLKVCGYCCCPHTPRHATTCDLWNYAPPTEEVQWMKRKSTKSFGFLISGFATV